eukprot:CAMPEP_0181329072 /NCGR_PEP_ID=MMETSP1101-20121128/23102_1 /TAXON_ID=46948 /ORGANISM="Rhodomonas abbreviata, Strain Caron Lab Isolate" /LENGTH=53 /DNA_ID=CAMNT_0023438099 /DNA_START=182 /DNA_END=343 /DNA_ORIENTATION=+
MDGGSSHAVRTSAPRTRSFMASCLSCSVGVTATAGFVALGEANAFPPTGPVAA